MEECNTEPCVGPGEWGEWSEWLKCTATCSGGQQRRFRAEFKTMYRDYIGLNLSEKLKTPRKEAVKAEKLAEKVVTTDLLKKLKTVIRNLVLMNRRAKIRYLM